MPDLDPEEFRSPPAQYYPACFWFINDRIEGARLLAQLRDMRAHGIRSVYPVPFPPEFRPSNFGSAMDVSYLGEDYFNMVRLLVAECGRLGMNYCIYDEGGWPAGGAAGRVYARDPMAFCRKTVVASEAQVGAGGEFHVPEDALCAAILVDGRWKSFLPGQSVKGLTNGAKLQLYRVHRELARVDKATTYVDVLCREATAAFLQMTHEGYKKHVGQSFGGTILGMFTDEPGAPFTYQPNQLTWTSDMAEIFKSRKGYDIRPWIPALLTLPADDEDTSITRTRVDFYDTWSQLFVERYLTPIREWCHANKLLSGGHFGGDDEPGGNAYYGYGHILRALRAMDAPSIDTIWRQIYPGKGNHCFPKYASSIARQAGTSSAMSESFAVYGNGLTTPEMRSIIDQQYVRGINLLALHGYPYSTRDHFMAGIRPHFGPVNPLWKYMDIVHDYTARLGYLLAQGRAVAPFAVYYDVRGIWAGASSRENAVRLHRDVSAALLESQHDFDYIDDDALADAGNLAENGVLRSGQMEYAAIVVPTTKWMDPNALRRLVVFVENGGTIIALEGLPGADGGKIKFPDSAHDSGLCGGKKLQFGKGRVLSASVEDLPSCISPLVRLDKPCAGIRVCARNLGATRLYFLANEDNKEIAVKVFFREHGPAAICDLENGRIYAVSSESANGETGVELKFTPLGSVALVFGAKAGNPLPPFITKECLQLDKGWSVRAVRQYGVGARDYEVKELSGEPVAEVKLGDWKEYLEAHFSGDAVYTISFDCAKNRAALPAQLDMGKVCYACSVSLNGKVVGRKIWAPYALRLDGLLKEGRNDLRITVTNTLANALLDPRVAAEWSRRQGAEWPVKCLSYDERARKFEQDSLPSGLYGPVRIVFAL